MTAFKHLFLDELADTYNAERRLLHDLPKMARAATSEKLKTAMLSHLRETEGQVTKLKRFLQAFARSRFRHRVLRRRGANLSTTSAHGTKRLAQTAHNLSYYARQPPDPAVAGEKNIGDELDLDAARSLRTAVSGAQRRPLSK